MPIPCETNNLNDLLKQNLYINEKLIKDKIDFENKNNPGVMIGVDQYLETTYIEVPKYFTFSINIF